MKWHRIIHLLFEFNIKISREVILLRNLLCALMIMMLATLWVAGPGHCQEEPLPKPLPLLSPVPPEKLIQPGEGLGKIKFGSQIKDVEEVYGRGRIIPNEPDRGGQSSVDLVYPEIGLQFTFFNGFLSVIGINFPGYGTEMGVQVGVDVGDLIREFGTAYQMQKNYTDTTSPNVQIYDLYYEKISATIKGNLVAKIRIRTKKKYK